MKTFLIALSALFTLTPVQNSRIVYGIYSGGSIVTTDGEEWLLDELPLPDESLVKVHFDTKGTKNLKDDEIKEVELMR